MRCSSATGPSAENPLVLIAELAQPPDAARLPVVHRDEVVAAEEEVDVARRELAAALRQIDAVENEVEIAGKWLHLRVLQRAPRIVNRERVKREDDR